MSYAGEIAVSTGWGKTEKGSISPVLKQAELQVVSNEDCAVAWENVGEGPGELIRNDMICAGGGSAGPCNVIFNLHNLLLNSFKLIYVLF